MLLQSWRKPWNGWFVAYQFESKGIISISGLSEDDTLELVIDYDIEEIESQGEIVTVICKPDNFLI